MSFEKTKENSSLYQLKQFTGKQKNKLNRHSSLLRKQSVFHSYLQVDSFIPMPKTSKLNQKPPKIEENIPIEEQIVFNGEQKISSGSEQANFDPKNSKTVSTKRNSSSDLDNQKQNCLENVEAVQEYKDKESAKLKGLFKHRFSSKSVTKSLKIKHSMSSTIEKNDNLFIQYLSESQEKKCKAYSIGYDGKADFGEKIKFCVEELPLKFWRKNSLELVRKIKKIQSVLNDRSSRTNCMENQIKEKVSKSKAFNNDSHQTTKNMENTKLITREVMIKHMQMGMEKYESINQNNEEVNKRKELLRKFNANSNLQRKGRKLSRNQKQNNGYALSKSKIKIEKKKEPIFMLMSSTY